MDKELLKTISRLRRAMPRNEDVMALCDALEARLLKSEQPPKYEHAEVGYEIATNENGDRVGNMTVKKFDKTAYQREYMRKRRAERPS
jgi:hypothetical protein